MPDLPNLAASLLANFRTVRIPSSEHLDDRPGGLVGQGKGKRADHRAAYACRDRLRRELVERGHHCFLHLMEPDRAGGWRLHFLVVDVAALTLLDELTEGACGPGDP